jgi:hypothetical protein
VKLHSVKCNHSLNVRSNGIVGDIALSGDLRHNIELPGISVRIKLCEMPVDHVEVRGFDCITTPVLRTAMGQNRGVL